MEERKKDHIDLALDSRTLQDTLDKRFNYEPLLNAHPSGEDEPFHFLGKQCRLPLWVSSMTGGTKMAGTINRNLARACNEFGLGMGLGSCRILLDDETYFEDFNMRPIIGDKYPFYANLGVAQVEELISTGQTNKISKLIEKLKADGLIIHVNPIQEFCQPEGDRFQKAPIDTIKNLLELADYPLIVKEVGQGMGPQSLKALMQLPLEAIEFAAYGGTNFAMVELIRSEKTPKEIYKPLTYVGQGAEDMVDSVNLILETEKDIKCNQLIVSGGISNFLDGYYLINKSKLPAIYGQASAFLRHAMWEYGELKDYIEHQVNGLRLAKAYLTIKEE